MIYGSLSIKYLELNILTLPVKPGTQFPSLENWTEKLTKEYVEDLSEKFPDYGICLPTGKYSNIVAIDIDVKTDTEENILLFDKILSVIPPSPCSKVGGKGRTLFYKNTENFQKLQINGVIEILSTGQQTVLPPTIYPKLENTLYRWVGEDLLSCYDELPTITHEECKKIIKILENDYVEPIKKYKENNSGLGEGRNAQLMRVGTAKAFEGCIDKKELALELLAYDEINHTIPWFSDPTENHKGKDPHKEALYMAERILKFVKKEFMKDPIIEEIKKEEKFTKPPKEKELINDPTNEFPLDIFPIPVQDFIKSVAENQCTHVEYVAIPFLIACATLIGRDVTIKINESWTDRVVLWGFNIGSPSENKTNPAKYIKQLMLDPFNDELQKKYSEEYSKFKKEYAVVKETINIKKSILKKQFSKEVIDEEEFSKEMGGLPQLPVPPPVPQMIIGVPTKAAIVSCSDASPRLTVWMDEVSGFLAELENDKSLKSIMLECFTGNGSINDIRKTVDSNTAKKLYCNMFGTIQPDKVRDHFLEAANDGFAERFFLMAYPKKFIEPDIYFNSSIRNEDYIRDLAKKLYNVGQKEFRFNEDSFNIFRKFYNKYRRQSQLNDTPDELRSFYAKIPMFLARVSTVLNLIERVNDASDIIPKQSLIRAESGIERFFLMNFGQFLSAFDDSWKSKIQVLFDFIVKDGLKEFTVSGLVGRYKIKGLTQFKDINTAIGSLASEGKIVALPKIIRGGGQVFSIKF